jgi:hypothetical protein
MKITIIILLTIISESFFLPQIANLPSYSITRRVHTSIYSKINRLYQETADKLGITSFLYPKHRDAIVNFFTRVYALLSELGKSQSEVEKFLAKNMETFLSIAKREQEKILDMELSSSAIKPQFEPFIYSVYKTLSQLLPSKYLPPYEEISKRIIFLLLGGTKSTYTNSALGIIILDLGKVLHTLLIPQKRIAGTLEYALTHELLHLLSYPIFNFLWDEGVTTYFSRKWTGYTRDESIDYKIAKELIETVGEETTLNCYLSGDLTSIREKVGSHLVDLLELSGIFRFYMITTQNKELFNQYCQEIVKSCSKFLPQEFILSLKESKDPISILIWKLRNKPQALQIIKEKIKTAILEPEFHPQREPSSG